MECFTPNGHLTDDVFAALQAGSLNELERLEVAEHLDFCDDCLTRYTAFLTGDVLQSPATPLVKPVLARIRRKGRRTLFARYGMVAAAACMAVLMWGVGSFALPLLSQPDSTLPTAGQQNPAAEPKKGWLSGLADQVSALFGKKDTPAAQVPVTTAPAPQTPVAPEPQVAEPPPPQTSGAGRNRQTEEKEPTRAEREDVFNRQRDAVTKGSDAAGGDASEDKAA